MISRKSAIAIAAAYTKKFPLVRVQRAKKFIATAFTTICTKTIMKPGSVTWLRSILKFES